MLHYFLVLSSLVATIFAENAKDFDGMRLEFVQTLWRHGDRAALDELYPIFESNWTFGGGGLGELTPLGMSQMNDLGTMFRRIYVEEQQFLSHRYVGKEMTSQQCSCARFNELQEKWAGLPEVQTNRKKMLAMNLKVAALYNVTENQATFWPYPDAWKCQRNWFNETLYRELPFYNEQLYREALTTFAPYKQLMEGHFVNSSTVDGIDIAHETQVIQSGALLNELFDRAQEKANCIKAGRNCISSVKELHIRKSQPVNIKDLKYLLENIKVTDEYVFCAPIPVNFSYDCDPQIFKCRKLDFGYKNSADWVTLELLCQFDVPQLTFWVQRFSVKDIVSYATHWFNSENSKLEFAKFKFINPTLENFTIDHLNPMPFCEKRRNRCPFVEEWKDTDMSSGVDILRKDGLLATFYVDPTWVIFYIWHKRFPDDV
ncbi:hypothetical protein CAEBREN_07950 [Caenorhabditis brenneri]|uniref:Sdz-33 F-box domain-containing protein n=1 Tax=Caenorhabditis brenneri TaxID=135651 RepID=G0NNX6_CAEBE|nr:hypothetical protein CAEBREN_07950 [Caenorhabditis brenneri]